MTRTHLVWDWNGTLLDDLSIVVEAVNASIGSLGAGPITADEYRDHYTRPVRIFYDRLLGRIVSDEEWLRLNTTFHDEYFRLAADVALVEDAMDALAAVADAGWTQSLLSMSPQDWLIKVVERLGLSEEFVLVDGLSGPSGGLKAGHLAQHLDRLGLSGRQIVMIGDTPDDVAAAQHVRAKAVLFHGGSHHLDLLESEGVPVAETLLGASKLAIGPG